MHPRIRDRLRNACAAASSPYAIAAIPVLAEGGGRAAYPWIDRISVAADKGDWANAFRNLEAARRVAGAIEGDPIRLRAFAMTEASLLLASGKKTEAAKLASGTARQSLRALEHDTPADLPDELDLALSATLVALRAGDGQIATEALEALDSRPHLRDLDYIAEMKAVVRAWQSIDAGRGSEAIALLKPFVDGSARYQTHQALLQAYVLTGDRVSAAEQAKWLQQRRGLAYIEQGCGQCRQTLNVIDSNQANRFSAKQ